MRTKLFWIGVACGIGACVVIGVLIIPALGLFSTSANGGAGLLDWWGNTNLHGSLRWRAPNETLPANADAGFGLGRYMTSCVHCHGTPDLSASPWAESMKPAPPHLWDKDVQEMSDGQIFYVISEGIRMTGMPSFKKIYEPTEIWNTVAYVRQLGKPTDGDKQKPKTTQSASEPAR
jgi:mono/diheme cytochrome c family protein